LVYLFFPHPSPRIFGSASTTMPEPLEIEQRTYEARQQELLAHQGKYVVIKAADVGVYDTYEDALKAAYDEFGLQPFFVRRIEAVPQIGTSPAMWQLAKRHSSDRGISLRTIRCH